ncbi:secreted RxLR effector protein 78-like [Silene latifolia]|uniref:secreted RxLR effector protein 78-like n=1 Tax=Silene latifolia TaxID=37657 RepID=UPI003D77CB33
MKIVTKCISSRLKKVMSFLVGDFQNGFIPGRNISDNILISHELFHHIGKKTRGNDGLLTFKVDMSKAYDRLDWNFLRQTFTSMQFPHSFINLIMNCVSSVSYQVMVNGCAGRTFHPNSGIRQGDPMSPYLFALCTEVLSQLLFHAEEKKL